MQAIVLTPEGQMLSSRAEPIADLGEAVVRVAYCGICGSDLHARTQDGRLPVTLGHEFSGIIERLAPDLSPQWKIGDRVVINPNGGWCGNCRNCRSGRTNQCHAVLENSVGYARDGGLAALVAVPSWALRKIPHTLPLQHAAWVEPVAVALRTLQQGDLRVGDRAAVIGAGPIGLLLVGLLADQGVSEIAVIEPGATRRAVASVRGATRVFDPLQSDVTAFFESDAPEVVFECSGAPNAFSTALSIVAPGGTVVLTGIPQEPASIDIRTVVHTELTITSSFIYTDEFDAAIELLDQRRVDVDALTTSVVGLDEITQAFSSMGQSDSEVKVLVSPGGLRPGKSEIGATNTTWRCT